MANSHRSDSVTGSSSNRHALVDEVRPTLLGIWFATDSALEGRVTSESGNPDFGSSRWHFAVNGLAGVEADGLSHAVKVFTELTVVEGTTGPSPLQRRVARTLSAEVPVSTRP
jgi:hypothetical protein